MQQAPRRVYSSQIEDIPVVAPAAASVADVASRANSYAYI